MFIINSYIYICYNSILYTLHYDLGIAFCECQHFYALMWYKERKNKHKNSENPKYNVCCGNGKVEIPFLKHPPQLLAHLLFYKNAKDSKGFQTHLWTYNMMFTFTSASAKLDIKFNNCRGSQKIRIQGQSCPQTKSLLPPKGESPKFTQLYIYDSKNEVTNRMDDMRESI